MIFLSYGQNINLIFFQYDPKKTDLFFALYRLGTVNLCALSPVQLPNNLAVGPGTGTTRKIIGD